MGGSVLIETLISLDGSASADPNLDPLTYTWSLTSAPELSHATIVHADPTASLATLVPDLPGTYVAQLVVSDGLVSSSPNTVSWLAYTTPTVAITEVQSTQQAIASLPPAALRNANLGKALTNKLNEVINAIQNGQYTVALHNLETDVLQKTNGCATTNPPVPDANDWIKTCADQATVYPLVLDLIAQVMALM